jgi:hypothetical protein
MTSAVRNNGIAETALAPAPANGSPLGAQPTASSQRVPLTPAQQKQIVRLAGVIGRADIALQAAQEASEVAQGNASAFVGYCAEEHGINLGIDGWRFDQGSLSFVKVLNVGGGEGDPLDRQAAGFDALAAESSESSLAESGQTSKANNQKEGA